MKESTQTLLFLVAAIASVFVAVQSRPTDVTYEVSELIGKPLFPAFATEEAKALRIVRFNEETATLREFEVAEEEGVWSIPSKGGYPADAQSQMAEATTGVIDLEILSIATQSAEDHEQFGVIEPSSTLEVGATGVGTHVVLTDGGGESLVDVIVGKGVKDAEDQHYVRRTTQDVVFTVAIDPEKFSTTFEDWIEDDLLDLSPFDIARANIRDFSAELVMQGFRPAIAFDPRGDYSFDFDEDENAWKPNRLRKYNQETQAYEAFELGENESLNDDTLGELKNAVSDLRIVDVERKPSGLSADLKAGDDFFGNEAAVRSLMERGFAPTKGADGETEVLSSEGEVLITTKEGVEYVLRFGKLQLSADAEQQPAEDAPAGEEADESTSGVNRYLFVMARVNDKLIDQPELEELPPEEAEQETNEEAEPSEEESEEDEQADEDDQQSEREAIEQRNQRAQDEYEAKLQQAADRAAELNARFGDWYYVIEDSVYKKIAVGRDELIQVEEPAEEDQPEENAGPLGTTGGGIPGLTDLPGVEFNPEAAATTEDGVEEAAEEAADETPAEDAVEQAVEEAAVDAAPAE